MEIDKFKINVSKPAIEQIKIQLSKRGAPNGYLRLGVKGGGCSGFAYHIQFEDSLPKEKDIVFNIDGVQIIADNKSIIYLSGCTLDWEATLFSKGFKFINPNEKSSCSCGRSFSF
jgi:iron-sulfur cluster assembly protein